MFKFIKSGVGVSCLLAACLVFFPAWANAAGGGAEISLKIHGGYSHLQAKDANTGLTGFFDFYRYLAEGFGYTVDGDYSPFHGGYDVGADLIIPLSRNIGIGIGAGYLQSTGESEMILTYMEQSASIIGQVKLSAMPIRLGVFLDFPVSDKLIITANAGAAVYTSLKFTADLRLEEDEYWDEESLDASRTSFSDIGFQGGLGFEYMIGPKLGLFVEALGRYARFKNYESVTGINSGSDGDTDTTEGKLYLQKITDPELTLTMFVISETPPVSSPPELEYSEPKFDFSGYCLQAGFRIRF